MSQNGISMRIEVYGCSEGKYFVECLFFCAMKKKLYIFL